MPESGTSTNGHPTARPEDDAPRLGVAVVGLGGAVATTAVAGVELMRRGLAGREGLPLAALDDAGLTGELVSYENLVFGGWDLSEDDLASAAHDHGVLAPDQFEAVKPALVGMRPWPAVAGDGGHAVAVETVREDLRRFGEGLDGTVVVNLASTEYRSDPALEVFATLEAFERGVAEDDPAIKPAMIYAYAAILEGVPYVNFTPSLGADVPALVTLAEERGVPVAGRDGKTGQTMLKTVLGPAFRSRALKVEGWFSTNILGNGDGLVLSDPNALASKVDTKGSVLDSVLGYEVPDHVVAINYYRPRGDNKEAWDNVDLVGFLGQRMQVKVNFLCGDSVLAAPLVIELARLADLARRRGESGAQEQLGLFFKAPTTADPDATPEHAFHKQEERLLSWLSGAGEMANGNGTANGVANGTAYGVEQRRPV